VKCHTRALSRRRVVRSWWAPDLGNRSGRAVGTHAAGSARHRSRRVAVRWCRHAGAAEAHEALGTEAAAVATDGGGRAAAAGAVVARTAALRRLDDAYRAAHEARQTRCALAGSTQARAVVVRADRAWVLRAEARARGTEVPALTRLRRRRAAAAVVRRRARRTRALTRDILIRAVRTRRGRRGASHTEVPLGALHRRLDVTTRAQVPSCARQRRGRRGRRAVLCSWAHLAVRRVDTGRGSSVATRWTRGRK
jgi:hypothetical protein